MTGHRLILAPWPVTYSARPVTVICDWYPGIVFIFHAGFYPSIIVWNTRLCALETVVYTVILWLLLKYLFELRATGNSSPFFYGWSCRHFNLFKSCISCSVFWSLWFIISSESILFWRTNSLTESGALSMINYSKFSILM